MNVFIGIDPSINSTGMTIMNDEGYCQFFIVHEDHYTKKEKEAALKYVDIFHYCTYLKEHVSDTNNAHERELAKAHNLSNIADTIYNVIMEVLRQWNIQTENSKVKSITICIEGISYGSIKSSAVMDLAGLNYLIRDRLHHHNVVGTLLVTPPGEIKKFFSGSGNSNKDVMMSIFKSTFPEFNPNIKIDDIADSYAMSKYAQDWFEKNNQ